MSAFPKDRRPQLFGREPAVHDLCDRARHAGLTVVAARPLMGKTWTLTEVARRLEEEGTFIVGYHESKGAESSHLLYAVSNLYTRWLEDSRMWDQARSLWERHKDDLVPRIGQAIGTIVEKLGSKLLPEGVASIVQKAFDGLAQAQGDLLQGGLQLAPLPYDEALALTNLVTTLSGKRVVLILDAWEKSPSIAREFATLEAFAKNPEAWPDAHLVLAVRDPEIDSTKLADEASRRGSDLCRISSAAKVYELPPIDNTDAKEQSRLVDFVRAQVPAAKDASDARIIDMVAGYPGVLGFWLNESTRRTMRTPDDLNTQAGNAQALRYIELEHLLAKLGEPALSLAARLTVLPRLDTAAWAALRATLPAAEPDDLLDALVDAGILVDESFPTFGHDTRYVAARRWFVKHKRPLMKRQAREIVDTLAGSIDGVHAKNFSLFALLVGCSDAVRTLQLGGGYSCLVSAARSAFRDASGLLEGDFHADCNAAIRRQPAAAALVALALVNRAIANEARGDFRAERADYDAAVDLPGSPPEERAKALSNRAIIKAGAGDREAALADFDQAVALPTLADPQLAQVLVNRGVLRRDTNDHDGAVADYTRVIDMPRAASREVAHALVNRAAERYGQDDVQGANNDLCRVISMPTAPADQVSMALLNRAILSRERGDSTTMMTDFTTLIEWPLATARHAIGARMYRGVAWAQQGDSRKAIEDFDAVLAMPGTLADDRATAYFNRASVREMLGDLDATRSDLKASSEVPGASAPLVEAALAKLAELRIRGDGVDLSPAPDTP